MFVSLAVSCEHREQLELDKNALLSLDIILPMKITRWILTPKPEKELCNHRYAEANWNRETEIGTIWFFDRYFKQKEWKRRMMTFLHELIHIYHFSSEPELYEWKLQIDQLLKERIKKETKEERYHIDMANWVIPVLYPETLKLPFHFFAEEFFKQKYPKLFKTRINVYYDLKVEWESSFEEWKTNYENKGYELVAPYVVYIEMLKIRHFLKLIKSKDSQNLKRFQQLYEKRKNQLRALSNSEQMEYFNRKEEKLINVSLEPLSLPKKNILDLATRF